MSLNKKEEEFFNNIKHDTLKLVVKMEKLEHQINEIMLILEDKKNNDSLWETLKKVETRINDRVHALESAAILEQEQANQEIAIVTTYTNDARQRTRESNEEYIKVRNK